MKRHVQENFNQNQFASFKCTACPSSLTIQTQSECTPSMSLDDHDESKERVVNKFVDDQQENPH